MRAHERLEYLRRVPVDLWNLLVHARHSFTFDWMPMVVRNMSLRQRINMGWAGLNLLHRRTTPWAWPLHMQIELTNYCNLRCPVCPTGRSELSRRPQAIDVELFERLFDEVGPYLLTAALWAWGEPLLHPQLDKLLAIARLYPATILLSTNGQNLDQPFVQETLRRLPPSYLIVAVDGLCDETNSAYRQGARREPVWRGAQDLAAWKRRTGAQRPILLFRFIAMKHNEREIPRVREVAFDHGFDMVSIRSLSIIDSKEEQTHKSLLPEGEALRAYEYAAGRRVRREDFVCQHAFNFPTVLADGTVVACDQDYNGAHAYGRLSPERSFADVWRGPEAARVRRTIRDDSSQYSFCRSCPLADRPTSSCSLVGYTLRPFTV